MRKFNPVQYNRDRWGDRLHTKNHPKQCATDHQFCHLDYEWANDDNAASVPLNEVPPPPSRKCWTSPTPLPRRSAPSTTR
jgi:hypothetical protein